MPPPVPPQPPRPTIDYHSSAASAPRRPIVDVPLLTTGILFSLVVSALVLVVSNRLMAVFQDFGTKLPAISVAVFRFCHLCRIGGLPVIWVLMLAPAFLTPLLRSWPPDDPARRHSRVARILVTFALALFTGWIALGLFMPYVALIDAASGGSPKK